MHASIFSRKKVFRKIRLFFCASTQIFWRVHGTFFLFGWFERVRMKTVILLGTCQKPHLNWRYCWQGRALSEKLHRWKTVVHLRPCGVTRLILQGVLTLQSIRSHTFNTMTSHHQAVGALIQLRTQPCLIAKQSFRWNQSLNKRKLHRTSYGEEEDFLLAICWKVASPNLHLSAAKIQWKSRYPFNDKDFYQVRVFFFYSILNQTQGIVSCIFLACILKFRVKFLAYPHRKISYQIHMAFAMVHSSFY